MQGKKSKNLSDAHLVEAARLFGILAEPARLKLLRALMERAMNVSELIAATGMRQGNVSKHLGVLLNAHFVSRKREGNFVRYAIADPRLRDLCELMCTRIDECPRPSTWPIFFYGTPASNISHNAARSSSLNLTTRPPPDRRHQCSPIR